MGDIAVSRSIGDFSFKEAPFLTLSNEPDVCCVSLGPRDQYILLGCDGLFDVMTAQEAFNFIERQEPGSMSNLASTLVHEALRKKSRDNVSVVLAELKW